MSKPESIKIDDVEYVRKGTQEEIKGDIKIVILQRGWIMVGRLERKGSDCILHKSAVIRKWGTEKGLGQIALNGPTTSTVLDKNYGVTEFDYLTVVAAISCKEEVWVNKL